MMKQLLEILRDYRLIDRAILFLRLFAGTLISLHIIDKLQTYNFVLTGYHALLFGSSWATFVIFTFLEAAFAVMIILGYGTRFAAFIMALGMFVEIFIVYPSLGWFGVERQVLYIVSTINILLKTASIPVKRLNARIVLSRVRVPSTLYTKEKKLKN